MSIRDVDGIIDEFLEFLADIFVCNAFISGVFHHVDSVGVV